MKTSPKTSIFHFLILAVSLLCVHTNFHYSACSRLQHLKNSTFYSLPVSNLSVHCTVKMPPQQLIQVQIYSLNSKYLKGASSTVSHYTFFAFTTERLSRFAKVIIYKIIFDWPSHDACGFRCMCTLENCLLLTLLNLFNQNGFTLLVIGFTEIGRGGAEE